MLEEATPQQPKENYAQQLERQLAKKEAELRTAKGSIKRLRRQIQEKESYIAHLNKQWYFLLAVIFVLMALVIYAHNDSENTVIVTAKITNVTERPLSQGIALTALLNQSVSASTQVVLELDLSETSYLVKTVIMLYFELENIDVDEYWNHILRSAKLSLKSIKREEVQLRRSLVKELMATVTNQLKKKDFEVKLEMKNKEKEHKEELRKMNENKKTELERMERVIKEKKEELRKKDNEIGKAELRKREKEIEEKKKELKEKEKEHKAELLRKDEERKIELKMMKEERNKDLEKREREIENQKRQLKEKEKENKAELKRKDEERKTELLGKDNEKNEEIKSLKNQLAEKDTFILDMLTEELNKRNTEDNTQVAENTRDIFKLCAGVLGLQLCAGFSV